MQQTNIKLYFITNILKTKVPLKYKITQQSKIHNKNKNDGHKS